MKLSIQDKQILRALEQAGRLSFAALAQMVGLSKTPCWNRVKSFQRSGIIKGYTAQLDAHSLGLEIRAFVHVVVNFDRSEQFEVGVNAHQNILRCEAVTGDFDYLLEVVAENMQRVARFSTSISTREVKHSSAYMPLIE